MCTWHEVLRYTNKDHGAKVFELTDMTDDHATMTHKPLFHDQEEVHVPLQKLPTWKATKALMPMLCAEELAREGMTAKILVEERARSEVQLALHKAAERHPKSSRSLRPRSPRNEQPLQPQGSGLHL